MPNGAFYVHLADAIAINVARRPRYAAMTAGRSRLLSHALVWFERLSLPFAVWLDRRARPFQARGIGVVRDDFVDMTEIREAEAPPRYTRVATARERRRAAEAIRALQAGLVFPLRSGDLRAAARTALAALDAIEDLEHTTATHHAMSRHFVESIGLAAANGIRHAEASDGATLPLTLAMLRTQATGLPFTTPFDRLAQPLHALGCGILVNDVPDIPFRTRWSAASR